jgi:glycosyltransferase involved in cell wall biosynthesis
VIKVGYIGDSPFIHSGFGVVVNAIMSRWPQDEFEVHVLGTMAHHIPRDISPYASFMPVCIHDMMGMQLSRQFLATANPDVLFFIGDPGTLRNRYGALIPQGVLDKMPFVSYFPIEGIPLNPHVIQQAKMVTCPVTYTKWGADLLRGRGVEHIDWAWHGFDHADFKPLESNFRQHLRKLVGWDDKFVCGMVAMNKRGNRQPTVLEAARIMLDRGYNNFVIYLHCQEKDETVVLGGWELKWMIRDFGLENHVILKPDQKANKYVARPYRANLGELAYPKTKEDALTNLGSIGFLDLLGMFDLYLDPGSVHGFNLPAGECARCGVPIAMVDDTFARREIYGDVAHMMEVEFWDYWHTGARLALVGPEQIADTIMRFMDDERYTKKVGERCRAKFDGTKWQPTADLFAQKIRDADAEGKRLARMLYGKSSEGDNTIDK